MVGHTSPYMTEEWGSEASLVILHNQQNIFKINVKKFKE